ncbi:hypothetical protein [Tolypothrix sp. VBCCA 56010]|uniref:hypothetical protein n=1 Tax=Tolypothrix sp. VBCCA 56010 TaxID=3137731 RepID=UPI003D7EC49A
MGNGHARIKPNFDLSPMPACPMPHAPCPMPIAHCPFPIILLFDLDTSVFSRVKRSMYL